jgi:hypothetical protein
MSGFFETSKVIIQRDGRVVVAGSSYDRSRARFALLRFLPNGRRDRSFFGKGLLTPGVGRLGGIASDLTIDGRGRLLATGGGSSYFSVVRILP